MDAQAPDRFFDQRALDRALSESLLALGFAPTPGGAPGADADFPGKKQLPPRKAKRSALPEDDATDTALGKYLCSLGFTLKPPGVAAAATSIDVLGAEELSPSNHEEEALEELVKNIGPMEAPLKEDGQATWRASEDLALLKMTGLIGCKWKEITAKLFPYRTTSSVRGRYDRLLQKRRAVSKASYHTKCRTCGKMRAGHICEPATSVA